MPLAYGRIAFHFSNFRLLSERVRLRDACSGRSLCLAEECLKRCCTLQRQHISDYRALDSAKQREERLSRRRSLEQQCARDRHATETVERLSRHCVIQQQRESATEIEAQRGKVGSLNTTSGIAPARPKCLASARTCTHGSVGRRLGARPASNKYGYESLG